MTKKQRLELTWVGKHERPRLEPRVLIEEASLSYHARMQTGADAGSTDNLLIRGDNLLALKALESDYAGKVKCVFIDPPYNTGTEFTQYEDGLEHSQWLSMMRDRLVILHSLLSEEGSLWITIDDNEAYYLKVMVDEIFGRANFVGSVVWEKDKGGRGDADISLSHDFILIFAKSREKWATVRNLLDRTETQSGRFKNPDNDPRGPWRQGDDGTAKSGTEKQRFPIELPSGRIVRPKDGRYWAFSEETFKTARLEGRAYFGRKGDSLPLIKRYMDKVREGVAPRSWWPGDEVGTNQSAKRDHLRKLLSEVTPFATPKPEGLVAKILEISTNAGDLVLDSFAGSGTTGAVAQKMGRRWIMVELGEHAETHIIPRMRKVIDGEDPGGVTETTAWQGGGGFRYCRLAPSLLARDRYGQWVISKDYQPEMLAEAVCKLMGFIYAPSREADTYWRHGHSTETDFIFVTTQAMTYEALAKLSQEVGEDRTLLVACRAYAAKEDAFLNITPKKIPLAVLAKCEWGRDDYSLSVKSNPEPEMAADEEPTISSVASQRGRSKGRPAGGDASPTLFGEDA